MGKVLMFPKKLTEEQAKEIAKENAKAVVGEKTFEVLSTMKNIKSIDVLCALNSNSLLWQMMNQFVVDGNVYVAMPVNEHKWLTMACQRVANTINAANNNKNDTKCSIKSAN